jgi:thioredoxin reductase (NADPH)
MKKLSEEGKIELVIPYQLDGLEGADGKLSAVLVKDFDGNVKKLEADYLLPFFGLAMELGPIADWGLSLHKHHLDVDVSTMQTSEPGIYAIGDIATYKNKLKLILTGFAEAATAAHDLHKVVYPNQAYNFEYSTSKGVS